MRCWGGKKPTSLTATEIESLSEEMLTLSGTVTLTTRTELLGIAVAAGRMGIEGTKNLSAFVKLVDALSVTTNLMGENAATSIARILEVAGEAQSNVTGVASAINALSNSVAATESEIVHFVLRLQSQYEKQNRAADRWIEKLSDTNGATEQMAAQAERAMSSYKLLGSEKLVALRSAIGSIRAETESLNQSLSATLSSLKDELDSLNNNQLTIETRAYQVQLASLQEQLDQARSLGNNEAINNAKEAIQLLRETYQLKKASIQSSDSGASASTSDTTSTGGQRGVYRECH